MKVIVVASTNPVKVNAVTHAFETMFPDETFEVKGTAVPSGVSDQPRSDAETFQGAKNRAENASKVMPGADYWVGLEGGLESRDGELAAFLWAVVEAPEHRLGKGRSGMFFLPSKIAELVNQGMELGKADDQFFGRSGSSAKNGAIGLLTGDVIDRTRHAYDAVVAALIPFKNPELYP